MKKAKFNTELNHDIFVLCLMALLFFAAYHVYAAYQKVTLKENAFYQKEIEAGKAWEEVNKAYERKAKLEEEAKEKEAIVAKYEQKIQDVKNNYKRLDRIQKDLDRIIGK